MKVTFSVVWKPQNHSTTSVLKITSSDLADDDDDDDDDDEENDEEIELQWRLERREERES